MKWAKNFNQINTSIKNNKAGIDLFIDGFLKQDDGYNAQILVRTGIKAKILEGYIGLVLPDNLEILKKMRMSNIVIVDHNYTDEIKVLFDIIPNGNGPLFTMGDKCCRLVIIPILTEIEMTFEL